MRYHQVTMNTLILLVFAVMIAVEQAAPISSNNTTATNSPHHNILVLIAKAEHEITLVLPVIHQLEIENVRHLGYIHLYKCDLLVYCFG